MRRRCHSPDSTMYYMYGARGITVCDRWLNSFQAFIEDMGEQPPGTTLDRIKGWLGYSPTNCRWATGFLQSVNQVSRSATPNISFHDNGYTLRLKLRPDGPRHYKRFKTLAEAEAYRDELIYEREMHITLGLT